MLTYGIISCIFIKNVPILTQTGENVPWKMFCAFFLCKYSPACKSRHCNWCHWPWNRNEDIHWKSFTPPLWRGSAQRCNQRVCFPWLQICDAILGASSNKNSLETCWDNIPQITTEMIISYPLELNKIRDLSSLYTVLDANKLMRDHNRVKNDPVPEPCEGDGNGLLKVYESTSLECCRALCQWLWNRFAVSGVKASEAHPASL